MSAGKLYVLYICICVYVRTYVRTYARTHIYMYIGIYRKLNMGIKKNKFTRPHSRGKQATRKKRKGIFIIPLKGLASRCPVI